MVAVVPVFNHAATVGQVVAGLLAVGAPVVVVDDGSLDGSGEVARAAGATAVIVQPENQGKGVALRAAFAFANTQGYEQALTCDADGQHPLSEALKVAHAAKDRTTIYVGCDGLNLWLDQFWA
jgi:glycosyltransferase involved in cell wall biosynthesis